MHKKEQKRSTTIFSSMLRIMSLVLLLQISVVAFFVFVKQITSLTNIPEGPIIEVTSKSVRMKKPRDAARQC